MLTLIQGYLYIMAFLTSVALHLPTSFNHIIEMKWSLVYLFHDTIIKTVQRRHPMLVKLWKGNFEHQATAMFQPKSSFVAIHTVNDKCTER